MNFGSKFANYNGQKVMSNFAKSSSFRTFTILPPLVIKFIRLSINIISKMDLPNYRNGYLRGYY